MKKFGFKTRAQWGYFVAALFGVMIALMLAPNVKREPMGEKTKIIINGKTVALCRGEENGREAYKEARLALNADGVKLLNPVVSYEPFDKENDAELLKEMKVVKGDELKAVLLESLSANIGAKKRAYTMRIDDYTVTVSSFEELIGMLEKVQGKYDEDDRFRVKLNQPASRNVTMYEVCVEEKDTGEEADVESETEEAGTDEEAKTEEAGTDEEAKTEEAGIDEEAKKEDTNDNAKKPENEPLATQSADDGVKYIGFSEKIQVMETYVSDEQIKDIDTAYNEITEEKGTPGIYVVKSGDYLDLIAEKTGMTVAEITELNPSVDSDENLYYDDRLNIIVPQAAVQVLVKKQVTYEESYNEDIVYEDDDSMFIGENEVLEEGSSGTHIVTDLVTYDGELEKGREQVKETVEVAAVAQVVRRGTKSRPTYMYPVTNWNVTSNFGYRWGRLHAGTDVGIPIGTTVRASRGGQVIVAGWVGGYGNCVMIDHGDGITTVYGHLSEINVSVGQYVDQGQQIALSGNTGRSTGPHLHFEIRVNGSAEDATPYLEGRK